MKFKEWFVNEINAGVARQFKQQYPYLPNYVSNQVLNNRIDPMWNKTMKQNMKTLPMKDAQNNEITPTNNQSPKIAKTITPNNSVNDTQISQNQNPALQPTINMPTIMPSDEGNEKVYGNLRDMFKDDRVDSIAKHKKWKKQVLEVHPLDFDADTVHSFFAHQFGLFKTNVRNHEDRLKTQSKIAKKQGQGNNEPIILVINNDKYRMQEGWHRFYSYLLRFSAPQKDIRDIKQGNLEHIDLSKWKPFKINAYVGTQD